MSTTTTTRSDDRTATLHLAFELGNGRWQLGFTAGFGQRARRRTIGARDGEAVLREIEAARARFDLPAEARVVSCYEAGRDGFWRSRTAPRTADSPPLTPRPPSRASAAADGLWESGPPETGS